MTPQGVRLELIGLISHLLRSDLALAFNTPIILERPAGRRMVAPPQPSGGRGTRVRVAGTLQEYRTVLREGDYLVVLSDGSVIQMAFTFLADGSLDSHRLAFLPCPIRGGEELLESHEDIETLVGMALEDPPIWPSELEPDAKPSLLRLQGPIRFDFQRGEGDELHSPSHVHFGADTCRLPVAGPLSIGHFVRFVFRHYFPEWWDREEWLRHWPLRYSGPTLRDRELQELHVASVAPFV